jgi:hypothetical protein
LIHIYVPHIYVAYAISNNNYAHLDRISRSITREYKLVCIVYEINSTEKHYLQNFTKTTLTLQFIMIVRNNFKIIPHVRIVYGRYDFLSHVHSKGNFFL